MVVYLLITDEFLNIISDLFLEESSDNIMPPLIGYAALDSSLINEYDGYFVKVCTCVTGHKIVVVFKETRSKIERLIAKVENILMEELMSPYVNDKVGLHDSFKKKVLEVFNNGRFLTSVGF